MIKHVFLAVCLIASSAWANTVELVVPWAAGGTTDKVAQVVLTHAKSEFAKHNLALNIVYKPGAGSLVGTNAVASAPAGTMQILVAGNTLVSTPIITPDVAAYDVTKDFVMLGYIGHVSMVTVVNSASGIRNIQDWKKACARRNLSYGTAGVGSNMHVSGMILNSLFGCNATAIPYKGAAPAVTDLLGGHIDYVSDYEAGLLPHITTGKFTAIVVLDKQRLPNLPNVPSITELSQKEYNYYNWFALVGNATADADQLKIAQQVFSTVLASSAVIEQLHSLGVRGQQPVPANFLATERRKYTQILRNANINK
jgi:tripartite-type tricarboxylate transporter receptor subunit TctC